jgi:hypothetical protein
MRGGFIFDDYSNIVTNPRVQPEAISFDTLRSAAGAYEAGVIGRPLATVSFALDYAIAGKDPRQFKLTSLAVHLVNAVLVLLLLRQILRVRSAPSDSVQIAAFAIALLWAIHPIQVSTVLYVVQRMETLSLTFVLMALCTYVAGRTRQLAGKSGWHFLIASPLLALIGLLSKESAVLFPVYTLALELALFRFGARSPRSAIAWRMAYTIGVLASVLLFLAVVLPSHLSPEMYRLREFSLSERLLTQLRVLPMYLGWVLLPLPGSLTFYYDNYAVSSGVLSPWTTLAGGVLLAALLSTAFHFRSRLPYAFLGVLWFFGSHLITSNVAPLELVFEHRNYFSVLAVLLIVYDLVRNLPTADPKFVRAGVAAVVIGFAFLTLIRTATWGDPLLLASDLVAKNPWSQRASSDLGEQYMILADRSPDSPFYQFAEAEFERGSRLPGASPLPEQALILLAATAGLEPKQEWWSRIEHKLSTQTIGPQESSAVMGLLKQRYNGLELDDAMLARSLRLLFSRQQMPAAAHAQYGDYALNYLHDEALATRQFVDAVSVPPLDPDYATQILSVLISENHPEQASAVAKRAAELGLLTIQAEIDSVPSTQDSPASTMPSPK